MEKTKIIDGVQCTFSEERFSIEEFHKEDQEQFSDGQGQAPYIQVANPEPSQDEYSIASYRVRIQEMDRPIFMRFKIMIRDAKMLVKNGNLDEKKMRYFRRIFTDDLTSLIQEAAEQARANSGQTIDLILKINTLGNQEITKSGRKFGLAMRKINRIREKMNFIPKMQQEELNSTLTALVSQIVSSVFDETNIKTYGGIVK